MKVICKKDKWGFKEGCVYECEEVHACTYFGKERDVSWVYQSKDDRVLFDFKEFPLCFGKYDETPKPKWRVGDYAVNFNNPDRKRYVKISEVEEVYKGEFWYNGMKQEFLRAPTKYEREKFYL